LLGYDSDEMGAAIPPLRAALAVFRKQKRPPQEIVKIVGPLCNAGWYCDRRLAAEYGDEAIGLLSELLGLSLAARLRPFLGKHLSLYVGLGFAAVRFVVGKGYGGIAGLRAMIVMYFNCVLSLGGVAATCLDAERASVLAEKLEHLTALGSEHAGTISYRFAVLLSQVPREYLVDTILGYRELLARLVGTKPTRDLPEDSRLMMIGGINYAIGALESFRDGDAALESAKALDGVGLKLYAMVADQVRANYHACRGEVELADYFRDRVEMHAVQAGSGWQAEVWAPASAILACMITDDIVGMKRTNEELDRLAGEIPSLRRHAAVARASTMLMRGDAAPALEAFRVELADAAPRSFIGWGAISGAWAHAANVLGEHAEAKRICESTLAPLSPADQELTAMYLILHLELALADTYLGRPGAGIERIDALLEKHRDAGGPVTMGGLHRVRALIAIHVGDEATARHHMAEMERRVRPTKNPGLLQQCEKLRAQIAVISSDTNVAAGGDVDAAVATSVDVVPQLAGLSHKERAEHVLAFIVARTGGSSGFLFDARIEGLAVLAPEPGAAAPEHVIDRVRRDLRAFRRNRRRASTELEPALMTMLTLGPTAMRTALRPKEHDYRTVILSADDERAEAVAAVLAGECHSALPEALVRALANALSEADEIIATPTVVDAASPHRDRENTSSGGLPGVR
jgi:hypothetical protein